MIFKKSQTYLLLALAGIALISLVTLTDFFQSNELAGYDWLMQTRSARQSDPDIVLIEIADDTLKSLGHWPLPRHYHAALIKALTESKAKAIVFDILFSERTNSDEALLSAMEESGIVYLPSAFQLEKETTDKQGPPNSLAVLGGVADNLKPAAKGIGHINIFVDPDGKVRRVPLWIKHADTLYPYLGFLVASQKLGTHPNFRGELWVNYPGHWTKTFKHFSYVDVLKAYTAKHNGQESWLDLNVFKDKICFVGLTATGTSDFRANPLDTVYPMVGTQASVCDSILRNDFIVRMQPLGRIIIACAIFLVTLVICLKLAPLGAFLISFLLAGTYTSVDWLLFNYKGIFLDLFLPYSVIALVYTISLFYKFFIESQKRKVLENELEIASSIQRSFLPPELKHFSGIEIRTYLNPAKFVAGDFYDVITLDESTLGVFIGDVSGKGISAALIMAQSISLLRVIAQRSVDPAQVLTSLNYLLVPILKGRFLTGQYLIFNTKKGIVDGACAGHPSLLFYNTCSTQIEELLPASGPPLGLIAEASYSKITKQITAGDKIFMYTDGWTESRDQKGTEFGLSRLKETLLNLKEEQIDTFLTKLLALHSKFEGTSRYDDLTAVLIEYKNKNP